MKYLLTEFEEYLHQLELQIAVLDNEFVVHHSFQVILGFFELLEEIVFFHALVDEFLVEGSEFFADHQLDVGFGEFFNQVYFPTLQVVGEFDSRFRLQVKLLILDNFLDPTDFLHLVMYFLTEGIEFVFQGLFKEQADLLLDVSLSELLGSEKTMMSRSHIKAPDQVVDGDLLIILFKPGVIQHIINVVSFEGILFEHSLQ